MSEPNISRQLAELWHDILRSDAAELFGAEAERLLIRHSGDEVAQPGYVGKHYRRGGLVFIGMNPGGGRDGLGPADRLQYEALRRLTDATDRKVLQRFDDLIDVLAKIMPTWKIVMNFVAPVLQSTNGAFDDTAYLNILKWRTAKSSGLMRLYQLSWAAHTGEQLELLAPGTLIAVGSDAGKALQRLGNPADYAIPRVIGNNIGEPGRQVIRRICDEYTDRRDLD